MKLNGKVKVINIEVGAPYPNLKSIFVKIGCTDENNGLSSNTKNKLERDLKEI